MAIGTTDDMMENHHPNRTVAEWMVTEDFAEREAIEIDIAGRLDLGLFKVGDVVGDLRPYVTGNASLPQTANALQLVVRLLNTIQVPMERTDVHLLVEYFSQRLENTENSLNHRAGIKETAEALLALANMTELKRFPPGDAAVAAKAVFAVDSSGNLRNQMASTRVVLFELLDFLARTYQVNITKDIGSNEFTKGLVSMAELEKDPSCLRVLFATYEELSQKWALDDESYLLIWESFSRYFPITLKQSARDPLAATPDELRALLLACFISNDFYATEAFPRLVDMLDTNQDLSANVKKDVFDTMAACVTGYSISVLMEWGPKLWDSLKFEIWNGENEEFIQGALKVINAMAQAIGAPGSESDDENSPGARFLLGVLKECVERIVDSKQRYMISSGRILYALASASPYTFAKVTSKTLPGLLILWDDLTDNSEKSSLLAIFNLILRARIEVGKLPNDVPGISWASLIQSQIAAHNALLDFKERLVEQVYWKAMTENISEDDTVLRVGVIQGLVLLTGIPKFLLDFEHGTIISSLNKIVLDRSQSEKMHHEAVEALQQISINDPERFSTLTLPIFIGQLPSHIPEGDSGNRTSLELDSIIHVLDALMSIACTEPCIPKNELIDRHFPTHVVFEAFQSSILVKIFELLNSKNQVVYINVLLAAILRGLQTFDAALDKQAALGDVSAAKEPWHHPYASIVKNLFQRLAVLKTTEGGSSYIGLKLDTTGNVENNEKLVSIVREITTLVFRSNQTTGKNNFLNHSFSQPTSETWSLFCEDAPHDIEASQSDLRNAPVDKYWANILSMSLVAGAQRGFPLLSLRMDVPNVSLAMLNNVIFADASMTPFARISMLQFLQLLVNKFDAATSRAQGEEQHLSEVLEDYVTSSIRYASDTTKDPEVEKIYQTLSYFAAAALARCEKSAEELISLMISGISKPRIGRKVAQSFRILLAPSPILTKENFCIIRPLRQGRLYAYSVDKLIALWRSSPPNDTKSSYLTALAGVLSYMDVSVYAEHAGTVLPIMLEGTNIQDDWTKLASITIIRNLIPSHSAVVTEHLDSVIARMTDRTQNTYFSPSDANVEARSAAIDVLALLTKYIDGGELKKRKAAVIRELDIAVDDVSSAVRARATACKLKWFHVDTQ